MEGSNPTPNLRPFGIGEILDAAFKVYKARFKTLCLCVLVPVVPITIVSVLLQASVSENAFDPSPDPETAATFDAAAFAGFFASILLQGLLALLATAACVKAVSAAYLGTEVTWQESLRFALRRFLPLIGATILTGLAIFAGFFALIVGAVFVYVRLAVVTPALLVEEIGATDSLSRSWSLVKDRFWFTFGTVLIGALLVGAISAVIQGLLIAPILAGPDSEILGATLTGIGQIVANVFTLPLQAAILTILYFDLRVRKEGLDVELLAQRIGTSAPAATGSAPTSTPHPSGLGSDAPSYGGFSAPRPPEERGSG